MRRREPRQLLPHGRHRARILEGARRERRITSATAGAGKRRASRHRQRSRRLGGTVPKGATALLEGRAGLARVRNVFDAASNVA